MTERVVIGLAHIALDKETRGKGRGYFDGDRNGDDQIQMQRKLECIE